VTLGTDDFTEITAIRRFACGEYVNFILMYQAHRLVIRVLLRKVTA
jgi:hypothetical protein